MPKTIAIIGSRRRPTERDFEKAWEAFNEVYEEGDRLVSGGCPVGGDQFAERIARMRGITITIHHADWKGRGRGAGFHRNSDIAKDADVVIALVHEDRTGGTEDTVKKALRLKKQVVYA